MTKIKNMTRMIGVVGEYCVGTSECGCNIALDK